MADETIRNFHKYGKGTPDMSQMEKERSALREKMSAKEKKLSNIKKQQTVNHNAPKKLRIGDTVKVMETRPLSKTKRWRVISIVEKAR